MSDSIFFAEDDLFVPTEHARGPWDAGALHGGAPAALIAAEFERMQPGDDLSFARLSFEFLRPVPMAPLKLTTHIARPGRRVQALTAELETDGVTVCKATALRLVATPEKLPELALAQVQSARARALAGPLEGQPVHFALDDSDHKSFASTAMEMRFLEGAPLAGELPELDTQAKHVPRGAAQVWMRLRYPVLQDRPLTPLVRLAATSDFGNGVATVLPFEEYLFINADLTISLDRRPQGEWVALDARTLLHPGGIGWAESVVHDELGPVGRAAQTLVVQPR